MHIEAMFSKSKYISHNVVNVDIISKKEKAYSTEIFHNKERSQKQNLTVSTPKKNYTKAWKSQLKKWLLIVPILKLVLNIIVQDVFSQITCKNKVLHL